MMRSMRAMAPWIMLIVAVAFVGWMVFQVGMDVSGQSTGGVTDDILRVNSQKITAQQFYLAVRNAQEVQRQQGGPPVVTLEDQRALEDAVVEQMIQEILLRGEYDRRGIRVSDEEVRTALLNFPFADVQQIQAFQTDSVFDISKYQAYLTSGADPQFAFTLENRYREQIPLSKFVNRIMEDVAMSRSRLRQIYADRNDSVVAKVVALVRSVLVPDAEVEPSESEIQAYYRAHRDDFKRPARAFLSYVEVDRTPNASDSAASLERAHQVRAEIAAGTDFALVAARESADSVTRENGGDLGMQPLGRFVQEFETSALALSPGQLSEPVASPFGYHIIRLESKPRDSLHARHILIPITLHGEHLAAVDARADSLDLLAAERDEPEALDTIATRLGLPVLRAAPVTQGERAVAGGLVVPDAGLWAFEAVVGQTSQVIEAEWAYFVFRLDSLQREGVQPVDRVRLEIARLVREQKKAERITSIAGAIAADLTAGVSLDSAAARQGATARIVGPFTRLNPTPALRGAYAAIGAAFGLPLNKAGGPYEAGESGTFFVEPIRVVRADSAGFAAAEEALRTEIMSAAQELRVRLIVAALREKATIVDRRLELARATQEQQDLPFGRSPLGN